MKLLLPILILFVFSEIAPRAGAQDHSSQPAKRDTAYDEIAQAPAKARAKRNPSSTARNAMEDRLRAPDGGLAFAHRKFRRPSQGRSFGF